MDVDGRNSEEDDSDNEEGIAPEHTQCFLALNNISENKTKVAVLDEMLQDQMYKAEDKKGGCDMEVGADNSAEVCLIHKDERILIVSSTL